MPCRRSSLRKRRVAQKGRARAHAFSKVVRILTGRPDCENLCRPLILIYDKRDRDLVCDRPIARSYNWIVRQDAGPALLPATFVFLPFR
jgi:hypothetical protein